MQIHGHSRLSYRSPLYSLSYLAAKSVGCPTLNPLADIFVSRKTVGVVSKFSSKKEEVFEEKWCVLLKRQNEV